MNKNQQTVTREYPICRMEFMRHQVGRHVPWTDKLCVWENSTRRNMVGFQAVPGQRFLLLGHGATAAEAAEMARGK